MHAQTPATSDPVETPVYRGLSTTATSSKNPAARPRTEPYVEIPPLTARTAALRPPTQSAGDASGNILGNVDQQGRQWLKKRTTHDQVPQKRTVQTKMTNFINDKLPAQSGSAYRAPIHDPLDADVFEQSVQFVKARKSGYPVQEDTASARSRLEEPFRAKATVSTRPQPQRKKRKSDEISTGSDIAEKANTNDAAGGKIELLASRPTAHKRFRLEQNDQPAMQDPLSNDRMETSSLTSLSKDPSSELDIDQEVMKSGLKVIRGRGMNMVMNTVYSSDADDAAAEERDTNADEAAVEERNADVDRNEDQAPVDRVASSTRSSVVPSSQPWERHESQPWYYHLQAARFKPGPMVEPAQVLNYRSSGIPLRTDPPAAEEHSLIANTELATRPGPSALSAQGLATLAYEQDVGNTRAEGTSRRSAAGEDLGCHIEEDIVAGGDNESVISNGNTQDVLSKLSHRTENDLDQSTLSQQREAAARQERYRRLLPSLTDDGFEAALAGNSQPAPAESAALVPRRDSHRSNDDSASHDSETVDFDKFMRRILPPPPKNKEPTTTVQSQDPMTAEKQGEGQVKQQAAGMEELATSIPLPLPPFSKILVESMQPPLEKSIPVPPLNSKLSLRPTSPQEEESYNTETVLPLTLDTQLHRPGILSPNFKLRIKSTRKNLAVLQMDAKDPTTPRKRQRFATQLITPGKQPNPSLASPEASRTPQHRLIPNPDYKSPESMIENVETLATWSPVKYETQRLTGAGQEQWGMDDEEKENQPPQTRPLESAGSRGPQSLDEIVSSRKCSLPGRLSRNPRARLIGNRFASRSKEPTVTSKAFIC
ncbi:hypothetical protein QFC22_003148 [Naganishia vaughanmartiniae]|uniref:Uncharacterized protein n=1 Tax=Naganishia vaughanmartiniae TaxID=1424756 RepID=A0ACC2X889_9TREE|nr:hypothetical protein QFC22_003148 [Naganishia vaughanmartiniae]